VNEAFSYLFRTHLAIAISAMVSGRLGAMSRIEVFTALHVMQTRYSEEISVRPSVRHTRDP